MLCDAAFERTKILAKEAIVKHKAPFHLKEVLLPVLFAFGWGLFALLYKSL